MHQPQVPPCLITQSVNPYLSPSLPPSLPPFLFSYNVTHMHMLYCLALKQLIMSSITFKRGNLQHQLDTTHPIEVELLCRMFTVSSKL